MGALEVYARSRRRPVAPPVMETAPIPAAIGGLNSVAPGSAMPATDCFLLYNMISAEYGLRTRLGSREWCSGLTGAGTLTAATTVRSILPFTGSSNNGAANKLFAATSSGIWDVTSSGAVATAWAGTTAYLVGAGVTGGGTSYIAKVAGTSASTVLPSVWVTLTAYSIGDRVINSGNAYIATANGTSGATGPVGTGTGETDGTVTWNFVSLSSAVVDGTVTWRHSSGNIAPTLALAFSITSGRAGHGVCHVQVTSAGHFLLYWDEVNGLHVYTESTGLWAAVTLGGGGTQISGVDPANLVFGTVFKGRVFHVEKDTAKLWYLAAGSLYGAASALNLGFKLKSGGSLVGVWSWTYDGGAGVDDALVTVSRGGDVVVFKGTDPSNANLFGIDGVWQVGDMPAGRELATDRGGDLLLATRMGILPMSKLVVGQGLTSSQYETSKISNLFNALMLAKGTTAGWTMRLHPEENAMMVTVPEAEGTATTQLLMSLSTGGWSRNRDLPIYSNAVFGGQMYFGTVAGSVYINDGYVDGRTLADPTAYTAVQYSGIGAFLNLGNARQKQAQLIRPRFLGQSTQPSFAVNALYDFDLTELATVSPAAGLGSLWDTGVWDTAVWGGDYSPSNAVRGATGMGVNVAMAWRGAAVDRTILVGFEVGFTQGGFL